MIIPEHVTIEQIDALEDLGKKKKGFLKKFMKVVSTINPVSWAVKSIELDSKKAKKKMMKKAIRREAAKEQIQPSPEPIVPEQYYPPEQQPIPPYYYPPAQQPIPYQYYPPEQQPIPPQYFPPSIPISTQYRVVPPERYYEFPETEIIPEPGEEEITEEEEEFYYPEGEEEEGYEEYEGRVAEGIDWVKAWRERATRTPYATYPVSVFTDEELPGIPRKASPVAWRGRPIPEVRIKGFGLAKVFRTKAHREPRTRGYAEYTSERVRTQWLDISALINRALIHTKRARIQAEMQPDEIRPDELDMLKKLEEGMALSSKEFREQASPAPKKQLRIEKGRTFEGLGAGIPVGRRNELIEMGCLGQRGGLLLSIDEDLGAALRNIKRAYKVGTIGEEGLISAEQKQLLATLKDKTTKVYEYFHEKALPGVRPGRKKRTMRGLM